MNLKLAVKKIFICNSRETICDHVCCLETWFCYWITKGGSPKGKKIYENISRWYVFIMVILLPCKLLILLLFPNVSNSVD